MTVSPKKKGENIVQDISVFQFYHLMLYNLLSRNIGMYKPIQNNSPEDKDHI